MRYAKPPCKIAVDVVAISVSMILLDWGVDDALDLYNRYAPTA